MLRLRHANFTGHPQSRQAGGSFFSPRGTKIGHAGTLDPFATGVLLLLIGKSTKLCEQLMDEPKRYDATMKFGATTPTEDPESPETPTPGAMNFMVASYRLGSSINCS